MPVLGEQLRAARTRKGVSIDEAADATKIRRRYLIALERDDHAGLPGGTYGRVFVRTYASYLGLDPEEMAAMLPAAPSPTAGQIERPAGFVRPPRAIATVLIAVFSVGALAAVIVALQLRQAGPEESDTTASGVPLPTAAPATATSAAGQSRVATAEASPAAGAPGAIKVQARATESVWISVTADGHQVFAGSLAKGQARTWDGARQIALRTGDGSRLNITVNGQDKGALAGSANVVDAEWTLGAQGDVVEQLSAATPQPARTVAPLATATSNR
jgi:cytoskeletal protein RodZ